MGPQLSNISSDEQPSAISVSCPRRSPREGGSGSVRSTRPMLSSNVSGRVIFIAAGDRRMGRTRYSR